MENNNEPQRRAPGVDDEVARLLSAAGVEIDSTAAIEAAARAQRAAELATFRAPVLISAARYASAAVERGMSSEYAAQLLQSVGALLEAGTDALKNGENTAAFAPVAEVLPGVSAPSRATDRASSASRAAAGRRRMPPAVTAPAAKSETNGANNGASNGAAEAQA